MGFAKLITCDVHSAKTLRQGVFLFLDITNCVFNRYQFTTIYTSFSLYSTLIMT